jgi:hypothetical protein
MPNDVRAASRRKFLRFLAESPLLYGLGGALATSVARGQDDAVLSGALDFDGVITNPAQAVNVWDFEAAIRQTLNPGHYATSRKAPTTSARWPRTGLRSPRSACALAGSSTSARWIFP